MKLAIIDLDGVIANPEARFLRAEVTKSLYLASTDRPDRLQREATDLYWRTVFDPALVELDTLIDGALDAIKEIEETYQVFYLTSRPESMREATYQWLLDMQLAGPKIVMKPPAFQYTKTPTWKCGTVQMLAALYGADEILIVDDEIKNMAEFEVYARNDSRVRLAKSLSEAIEKLNGTWVEPDPFLPEA